MNDKFCIVPWIHLNTEPNGRVKPCCAYFDNNVEHPHLQNHTLEEIWNCDSQKELRKQFLNNQMPNGCNTCKTKEDSGLHSFRMAMNDNFKEHIEPAIAETSPDGHYDKFNLLYWDFRFSNICNFKCRICGPQLSSSWHGDWTEIKLPKFLDKDYYGTDLMKYVDQFIDSVEEIYFAGGEPLMMPEHYQILDKLIERKRFDVFLRYNTNLSSIKYKSYDLVNIWKKFKKVQIYASIDGVGENAEFSRSGTVWKKVESNLIKLRENDIDVLIASAISIFNVFHLPEFLNRLIELNIPIKKIIPTFLLYPAHYNISILDQTLKDKLRISLADHLSTLSGEDKESASKLYDSLYYFLDAPANEQDVKSFCQRTQHLDKVRNEDITTVVPEIKEWYISLESLYGSKKK